MTFTKPSFTNNNTRIIRAPFSDKTDNMRENWCLIRTNQLNSGTKCNALFLSSRWSILTSQNKSHLKHRKGTWDCDIKVFFFRGKTYCRAKMSICRCANFEFESPSTHWPCLFFWRNGFGSILTRSTFVSQQFSSSLFQSIVLNESNVYPCNAMQINEITTR